MCDVFGLASSSDSVCEDSTTSAPRPANASAVARPMPRPEPVTTVFLPSYKNIGPFLSSQGGGGVAILDDLQHSAAPA